MKIIPTKIAIVALTSVMLFGLCSCSVINGISHNITTVNQLASVEDNSDKLVASRATAIVNAIKSKDSKALKMMFSKNSVIKIEKIDSKLKSFVNYCKGGFVSYKYTYETDTDNGAEAVSTNTISITLTTNKNIYSVGCQDITLDSRNKDNMGICNLDVCNMKDVDKIKADPSSFDKPEISWGVK